MGLRRAMAGRSSLLEQRLVHATVHGSMILVPKWRGDWWQAYPRLLNISQQSCKVSSCDPFSSSSRDGARLLRDFSSSQNRRAVAVDASSSRCKIQSARTRWNRELKLELGFWDFQWKIDVDRASFYRGFEPTLQSDWLTGAGSDLGSVWNLGPDGWWE
jgi:hypothetical protein